MNKWTLGQVGKTKPIQTQYKPNLLDFQMNVSYIITEDKEGK